MIPTTQVSPETLELVPALLLGSRLWSAGGSIDEGELAALRAALLRTQHRRQLAAIPAYARLAAELSIDDDGLDPDGEVFLLSDDWLKGYDPGWADNELPALTEWLAEVSTVRPSHPADVADLGSWRAALRQQEVYVTVSSGTRGTRSLVPRDRMTLVALRASSGVRLPWSLPPGQYAALLLTPRGMGSGIQSGAMGLGRAARRAAHLDDPLALDLLRRSAAEDLPVIVYGSPARLVDLLAQVGPHLPLPTGSCVVTGGGWKGPSGAVVEELLASASTTFALDPGRCVDTYSTAELNTVFVTCREGRYHVPPAVEVLVLDDALRPIRTAAGGRLAVLDPMAASYPGRLITSDVVRLGTDRCPCGLAGQTLLAGIRRLAGATERGCGVTGTSP